MEDSVSEENNNDSAFTMSFTLLFRMSIILIAGIIATCATMKSTNSSALIMLFRMNIVKVGIVLALLVGGFYLDNISTIIITTMTFILYWIVHGAPVSDEYLSPEDKERLDRIAKVNLKRQQEIDEDIEKNGGLINEEHGERQPLLHNVIEKGKDILTDGIIQAASIISNSPAASKISDVIEKRSRKASVSSMTSNTTNNSLIKIPRPYSSRRLTQIDNEKSKHIEDVAKNLLDHMTDQDIEEILSKDHSSSLQALCTEYDDKQQLGKLRKRSNTTTRLSNNPLTEASYIQITKGYEQQDGNNNGNTIKQLSASDIKYLKRRSNFKRSNESDQLRYNRLDE